MNLSKGMSRRGLLKSGIAVAGLAATRLPVGAPAAAAATLSAHALPVAGPPVWRHAVGDPRGIDIAITTGRNAEARYGLMFKSLPAFSPADDLLAGLAETMVEERGPLPDVSQSNDGFDNPSSRPASPTWVSSSTTT